ncbi:Organic cation transporter protein [Dirofilaria immitis]
MKNDDERNGKKQRFSMTKEITERKNLGDFIEIGKYTGYLCLLYELLVVSQVSNLIYMIYGGAATRVEGCDGHMFTDMTPKQQCEEYNGYMNSTVGCLDPILSADFESVGYEFHYFCNSANKVKLSISLQMIGIMFGAMIFGQLSDMFGRRTILMFGTVGLIVSGLASTFMNNLIAFTIARFFVMFFTGGKHSVSYVYMMENLPAKHRMWMVTVITYSPNYIVFTGLAYLTGEWRLLSRIVAVITILPGILLLFAYESPRWLIQKGRIDDARQALVGMGRWDKKNTPERLQELDLLLDKERERLREANGKPKTSYTYFHLFLRKNFALYSILFAYSLMITSIISYGLVFNMEKLSGSIYLNTIIVGSLRYTINLICAVIDIKFIWAGRRLLHGFSMFFIAFSLGMVFIIMLLGLNLQTVIRITALSAAAMCSQIYILNAVTPSELFPTAIRNKEIGFIQTFNRLGNIIAPQIFVIGELWAPLPYLTMCFFALVEVTSFLLIVPETKGKPMPDRMPGEEDITEEPPKITIKLDKNNDERMPLNEMKKKC